MILLATERLVIRNYLSKDWQALQRLIVRYQATEMAAYDRPWPTSEKDIKDTTNWFASGDNFLAVCLKGTGQLIGTIGFTPAENQGVRTYELGYVFDTSYHGRGYATEACKAVLLHAFNELKAEQVNAGTAMVNQPSIRLLERIGFQKTGEEMVSFRTDNDGNSVEFLGYKYELSRLSWKDKTSIAHE